MIHLHHADELAPLVAAMADVLKVAPVDPFTPEVVVVPAVGMRDAAMAGIGQHLGIAANIEYLFPGRFLARAMGDTTPPGETEGDPWRLPRLTWSVLDELASGAVQVPGAEHQSAWSLARHIADLFDRYATQRPQLVRAWAEWQPELGPPGDGTFDAHGEPLPLPESFHWQAHLWRRVRDRIGAPNPAEQLPRLLELVQQGTLVPQLPERVMVFGVGSLPPTMLQVLSALSAQREVHVFLRHPSRSVWANRQHRLAGGLNLRANLDVTASVTHPLLASWARPSIETRAILNQYEGVHEVPAGTAPMAPSSTLLAALQSGLRTDAGPKPAPGIGADGSLQVHACHGVLRQLEVLRDALGHAFIDDPSLQPHEVLVLCPDIATHAPLIEAVFGRGSLPVPVAVGDRALVSDEPVVVAVTRVLDLVSGRATLTEMLALLQLEPVRRRLGWSLGEAESAAQVVTDLGARWALVPQHREVWNVHEVPDGTWRVVIDQLLAGIACSAPTPRTVAGGTVPFDDAGTSMLPVIGGLADLLERLLRLHDAVQVALPIDEWIDLLHGVVDDFCAVDPREPWRRQQVHRDLADIARAARTPNDPDLTCGVPLALADVRALLGQSLGESTGSARLRSGAVTVTSMVPLHGVPARVVCILGLDDGTVRGGTFDGDDVLGLRPCIGERHPRFEGRQSLLDAVLSAGERLIITCTGSDITTNERVPFTVPLAELLDVVDDLVPGGANAVVVRHPRHGFAEKALIPDAMPGTSGRPFTFEPEMLTAATIKRSPVAVAGPSWRLDPIAPDTVDLDDVVQSIVNPARTYLRDRLDVRLPAEESPIEDGLPLSVDPLTTSALGRSLLEVHRRGGSEAEWEAASRLAAGMPPGVLSDAVLRGVESTVTALTKLADAWQVPLTGTEQVQFESLMSLDDPSGPGRDVRLYATINNVVRDDDGASRIVEVRVGNLKPSHRLALAVRLAVAQVHEPEVSWSAVLIGRNDKKVEAIGLRFAGSEASPVEQAQRFLDMAMQLHSWALTDAVPFFDRASFSLATGNEGAVARELESDFEYDAHRSLLWPDVSFASWTLEPVGADDPESVQQIARDESCGRAEAVARWVWDALHDCTEQFDVVGAVVRHAGSATPVATDKNTHKGKGKGEGNDVADGVPADGGDE